MVIYVRPPKLYDMRMMTEASAPNFVAAELPAFLATFLREVDWEKFFDTLPVEEFDRIVEDRMERIDARQREILTAQAEIDRLKGEVAAISQALHTRERFLAERQRAAVQEQNVSVVLSPKRKRDAVLRVFEDNAGRALTPGDVRQSLARAGLIDPHDETGTPVRIILAQLREGGVLEKAGYGEYRLRSRDNRRLAPVSGVALRE